MSLLYLAWQDGCWLDPRVPGVGGAGLGCRGWAELPRSPGGAGEAGDRGPGAAAGRGRGAGAARPLDPGRGGPQPRHPRGAAPEHLPGEAAGHGGGAVQADMSAVFEQGYILVLDNNQNEEYETQQYLTFKQKMIFRPLSVKIFTATKRFLLTE